MIKIKYLFYGILLCGISIVFYLSWLPNPDIGDKPFFPEWLAKWTNSNINLRTAVPFVFLGLIGDFTYSNSSVPVWKRRAFLLIGLTIIVLLAELGQLIIPLRHFDPGDIMWGITGAVTGISAAITLNKIFGSTTR